MCIRDRDELYELLNTTRKYIRKLKTFRYPELDTLKQSEDEYYHDYLRDDYRDFLYNEANLNP